MATIPELRLELDQEISVILASDFAINVTGTSLVPSSNDGAITFPNLDSKTQSCKLLETCVLYIDIRRSTELNLTLRPKTVAKLYSAFVRAMTKCGRHFGGHVRGIIGDRVMVIYDNQKAFTNAVNTAILMNATAKYVLNKHFQKNEINCGIGIDSGKILATKTGFRRRGIEQYNYKSLVWLGRPANVASKLTDIANKPSETSEKDVVQSLHQGIFGFEWKEESITEFFNGFDVLAEGGMVSKSHAWKAAVAGQKLIETKPATPPILMTGEVFRGYRRESPQSDAIMNGWLQEIDIKVSGYQGTIYGGDVIFAAFQNGS